MECVQPITLGSLLLNPGAPGVLFGVSPRDQPDSVFGVEGPAFEVSGEERGSFTYAGYGSERELLRGGREIAFRYTSDGVPQLQLLVTLRCYPESPVLRLRYRLSSDEPATLTKRSGRDNLRYLRIRDATAHATALAEIQLSHFDPVVHSYVPNTESWPVEELYSGLSLAGPILILHGDGHALMVAYEHGADHPQRFLEFRVNDAEGRRDLSLLATRGNYYHGQPLGPEHEWRSVWMELALAPLPLPQFLARYRAFFLEEICESTESRRPYLYYNTWNHQERDRYFRGLPYLHSMHSDRVAAEIEVAHRLGIDVFVIDTGWYGKTGDWRVNLERFPDGLEKIRASLDDRGMRLGLWFNPIIAALTSDVFSEHPDWEMTRGGKPHHRGLVWETEESTNMCLASPYADWYIEKMISLHDELGVSYFKWDAVGQYGCDSPDHDHGTEASTPEERADCYAYQMGPGMTRIVEEVSRRRPGVIVDFDITESGRFVGLGFLSVGKYFLVNNGPYFRDFDIPSTTRIEPDTINVFFHPGPARPRVCRTGIRYDTVNPSILFLTHYLPDSPPLSQRNSLAALVLGGNGIWGDLLSLGDGDIGLLSSELSLYKLVAEGATRTYPRVRGFAGSSPEVHEKVDPATASGLVAFFTATPGTVTHLTRPLDLEKLSGVEGADAWEPTPEGRLKLTVSLERDDARVVYVLGEHAPE